MSRTAFEVPPTSATKSKPTLLISASTGASWWRSEARMSASRSASGGCRGARFRRAGYRRWAAIREQDALPVSHQRFQRSAAEIEQSDAAASRQIQPVLGAACDLATLAYFPDVHSTHSRP